MRTLWQGEEESTESDAIVRRLPAPELLETAFESGLQKRLPVPDQLHIKSRLVATKLNHQQ
jgi:hypothetical protein